MIVVRDVFSLKFGKARDAKALNQELVKLVPENELKNYRILFDLVGPAYTMVFESTHESLTAWEAEMSKGTMDPAWKEWYQKFMPLVEKSYKEIFTIV